MNPNPENLKSPNAENEEKILAFWNEQDIFNKTLGKESPMGEFNFFEGPPTANGRPGIHHVGARSFKDVIPRYKTMRGFSVRRKAGWDTHGLPVELQVEKSLGLKSKKEIEAYGVADFNRKCKESVWMYKDEWEKLTARMGFWLDMKSPYVTYENSYIEALWATVKRANERGHLYKDFKVLPWCTRCGTALSSHELNQPGAYKDVKDLSVFAKFKIKNRSEKLKLLNTPDVPIYLLAWTTTPWTLPGNVGLAVNKEVEYVVCHLIISENLPAGCYIIAKNRIKEIFGYGPEKDFVWKQGFRTEVKTDGGRGGIIFQVFILDTIKGSDLVGIEYEPLYPFMNDLLPENQQAKKPKAYKVYGADFVTTTDGTGIVHTAVMYGADDFELGTKYELPKFHLVNEEGKFIEGCDTETLRLSGRYVKETDENGKPTLAVDIIDNLTARGLLFKKENYVHSYPHCWRCDTPLIYYARTSWYFSMSKLRTQLLDANEKINWEPDHIKEGRFGEWLDGIKDWAISRDRYWGTPLPVWSTVSGKNVVIGGLSDIKKYAKRSGNTYTIIRHGQAHSNVENVWDFENSPENHLTDEGRNQVAASAQDLKDKGIDMVFVSPILRTQETAKIVCDTIGFNAGEMIIDDRVVEWQVGHEYQGKSLPSYLEVRNKSDNRYTFKTEDGESFQMVIKRCGDFMYDIDSKYQNKHILIVCHNSSARALELVASGFTYDSLLKDEAKEYPFKNAEIRELDFVPLPHNENYELDFHKPFIDGVELELDGERLVRTPEVMDVWFDSGSMPIAQDHKLGEPVNFDPRPADYIAEGVDQTRGWFYTMHAIANMLHDVPTEAYRNVICMGLLMDANGQKMSKSRGNVVEPWAMFDKYGADVVRFWFYSVNQPGDSKNFDEKSLDEVNKKVFNPLRNVVSFYEMYAEGIEYADPRNSTNVLDQWILTLLDNLISGVSSGLDHYQLLEPSRMIRNFIGELSTWYIRRSRDRFKSDDMIDKVMAINTTRYVLTELAKVMAPFTPFLSEEVFQKVKSDKNSESVHLELFPVSELKEVKVLEYMQDVREIVTLGLEARSKANVKVRQPLAKISISKTELADEYLDIIKDELNVKEIVMDESLKVGEVILDTEITDELRAEGDMRDMVRAVQEMRKEADLVPSDRVTVHLVTAEPEWFSSHEHLRQELLTTVGATTVVWGSDADRVVKNQR